MTQGQRTRLMTMLRAPARRTPWAWLMLGGGLGWLILSATVPLPVRWMHGAAGGWLLLAGLADCLPRRWQPLTCGLRGLAFLWLLGGLIGYGATALTGGLPPLI